MIQSPAPAGLAGKYLTIGLGAEAYGIPVLRVREIIRLQKITPVPRAPECVKGVINLRGRVVPIVDLRVKFGLPAEFLDRTCIVVVQVQTGPEPTATLGLIVDRVEEVAIFPAHEIEPPPDFGAAAKTGYMLGLAKGKGQVKTLLNLDRIVAPESIAAAVASSD